MKSNKPRRGRRFGQPPSLRHVKLKPQALHPKVRRWYMWFRWCDLTNTRVKSNDPRHK